MKINPQAVEKYQMILQKDPHSQVFAPLAEAYREMGLLQEAEAVVTAGVQRHPQFVSGLVTMARILRDLKKPEKALKALTTATSLAPENILAHQLTAEIELANKNAKAALKAFKMVLFLNPQSPSAQKAVQKLESLTADEYDEDVFAMSKLPEAVRDLGASDVEMPTMITPLVASRPNDSTERALERMLSLIDAFIVRNDLEKAHALLKDTRIEFGDHPEIHRRMRTLQVRYSDSEEAAPPKSAKPRRHQLRQKKLESLNMMLRKIENYRTQG